MEERITQYADALKAEWRSSPYAWAEFHAFLKAHQQPEQPSPPVPLILAAASESDASKHRRLVAQLEWAAANNCLDSALTFLNGLPKHQWNTSTATDWAKDNYPTW